jgi:hypothetical protein
VHNIKEEDNRVDRVEVLNKVMKILLLFCLDNLLPYSS